MVNPGRSGGARKFRSSDVAYFAVTRFNLFWAPLLEMAKSHGADRHVPGHPEYAEYWRERIALFRKQCLPSMVNQRIAPHAWFIAFNQNLTPDIEDVLSELSQFPWVVPFFPATGEEWQRTVLPALLRQKADEIGKESVCSIRFDTDDTLHPSFFAALDGAVNLTREKGMPEGERVCFNLMHGLLRTGDRLQVRLSPTNQFLSVLEPAISASGPYAGGHNHISRKMPVVEVITQFPLWIYNLHEGSISGYREFDSSLDAANPTDLYGEFNIVSETQVPDPVPSMTAITPTIRFERVKISGQRRVDLTVDQAVYAIVTRFNLVWPELYGRDHLQQRHLPGAPGYQEYWRRRIALFEQGCLPSVLALDPRPDQWIIGFDEEVTPDIEALIARLSVYPWILAVLVPRVDGKRWESSIVSPALELLAHQHGAELVCSMRFDSDDAIHSRFISMIDTVLERDLKRSDPTPTPWCINPTLGLVEVDEGLAVTVDSATQFATIVERAGAIKGPYQGNHHKIASLMPLTEVLTSRPMWLYRRYGEGIDNAFSRAPSAMIVPLNHSIVEDFGLDSVALSAVANRAPGEMIPRSVIAAGEDVDGLTELMTVTVAAATDQTNIRLQDARDALAGQIRFALDVDEQLDLASYIDGFRPVAARVLLITTHPDTTGASHFARPGNGLGWTRLPGRHRRFQRRRIATGYRHRILRR